MRYPRMTATFEHLSLEILYEIFAHLQLHELPKAFSNLNCRLTTILTHMPPVPVFMGLNGMSMALTQFYYQCLSDLNTCTRLISLCVSDTLSLGNGIWLAAHLHLFVSLRHLALIDIKRDDFEQILDGLVFVTHLIIFQMKFTENNRAVTTFQRVPEGTYHERIFRSLPQLCVSTRFSWSY